ncbi:MAG: ORF6N domain-containing protein [Salinivirgaceae bacterium]|nr:ORF6N domain-containing protein [Salinivirgaceae bacterium]
MANSIVASSDIIKSCIYEVRNRKIMIDSDLAELYQVETKNLKRAVRMNIERFPEDFMFELTKEEYDALRCNFFTLKNGRGQHSKYLPYAFTQEGIAMLSGLLRSPIAIQVNINIMRVFFQMRQALVAIGDTKLQIEQIRTEIKQLRIDMEESLRDQNDINAMFAEDHDNIAAQLENINDAIAQLQADDNQRQLNSQRTPIGFKQS